MAYACGAEFVSEVGDLGVNYIMYVSEDIE
jgi:hypothetical protein